MRREFGFAFVVTLICLAGAFFYGLRTGDMATAGSFLLIAVILGVMEVSLSFDNAVVNASVLKNMDAVWQRRFLTWGILIAVFGMRFIFPIVIVAVVAKLGFIEVAQLAFNNPQEYARHLNEAHVPISAFGGTFLMLVFLKYLMDPEKEVHWLAFIERPLAKIGRLDTIQVFLTGVLLLVLVNYTVHPEEKLTALIAGLVGILTYIFIDALGGLFDADDMAAKAGAAGLTAFIYLEVLDASFSLDGVIGAFAITKEVVVIAAGLCIGAVFVRSLTLMLVKKGTLQQYVFLEHGAHYGIGALAIIMLVSMNHDVHIPEVVTGLIGVGFIVASVLWSMKYQRDNPQLSEG
ncbi:DUF475 domain-containing protein [Deinococcus cellulosilyticus]|uniref:DUF475 domain-containing protein n=1 Tax=Deinococcus cellulosilyticus (strain DSM 18568 / NBRC 106333 / KACC 11606 / 5516J-15) TaxID=1223518 RepID=A0A511MW44_DEIC1|nr:DUF475 domain-containing protein [Deinococcus cellulosilyticus]GEM44397.1 hypothetical protein DC3_00320 [Deinococcus cellulosilyticus NBRC 106333 = KACC 11606]